MICADNRTHRFVIAAELVHLLTYVYYTQVGFGSDKKEHSY